MLAKLKKIIPDKNHPGSSSLKKSIVVSYLSQIYVVILGILVIPYYITTMGGETYGLVGFFAMLQSWFAMLDLGLTPTISRETARFRGGSHSAQTYRRLFRSLSIIFFSIALLGGLTLLFASRFIGNSWLNVQHLNISQVSFALQAMAISVALRWMTGLYRSVISGSEQLGWLGYFNIYIASMRYLLVFPVLWLWNPTPKTFFSYQLAIAILEFSFLWLKANLLLPRLTKEEYRQLGWSLKPVKQVLGFSLSIALTSGMWILVTQSDKLIMSKILSLENYGYFSLVIIVASGIMIISGPISGAIMPRMAKLEAEGKQQELNLIYRKATRFVTIIGGSLSLILAFNAKTILLAWTGNAHIADTTSKVLTLYALGYGINIVSAFPYYLQFAKGKLKLHIIGSFLYIITLLPLLFWATKHYGMIGAGYAWFISNLLYFLCWTYVVHNTYAKGIHFNWLLKDVIAIIILPLTMAFMISQFIPTIEGSRQFMLLQIIIKGLIILTTAVFSSKTAREMIRQKINQHYER